MPSQPRNKPNTPDRTPPSNKQDQAENVPTNMLGEANYRKFVASYKPDGLIVGGALVGLRGVGVVA